MKKPKIEFIQLIVMLIVSASMFTACEQPEDDLSNGSGSAVFSSLKSTTFNHELAKRWAPIHYQDVDRTGTYSLSGKSDFITAINFDGDWVATNNWDNIENYSASAHCYYSVVETSTNWFIVYAFYHPRDWTDVALLYTLDQHENDLEGVLMIVEKDGSTYGELQAAVTVYHSDFYSYLAPDAHYAENYESVDGTLTMQTYNGELHPVTAQECKGHGLKAYPYVDIDGDGVIYYPSMDDVAEVPEDVYDQDVKYKLVDIFEDGGFWDNRTNTEFMESASGELLSSVGSGGANPPWNWGDGDDDIPSGYIATDPAALVGEYFTDLETFSYMYTQNDYSDAPMAHGTFILYAKHSDMCIDVSESSEDDGANVIQWEANDGYNQKWQVIQVNGDYYKLLNLNSNKALDVYNLATENGGNVNQWEYNGDDNQLWTFTEAEDGYFYLTSKNSGKVLDVEDASTSDGANIQQWSYSGSNNQLFRLEWDRPL